MKRPVITILVVALLSTWCLPEILRAKEGDDNETFVPVVAPWKTVVIDPEYRGAWLVAGDLDGDGVAEIVSARNFAYGPAPADQHYTVSAVAHRLDGSVLWRWGDPSAGRNELHHDVACQIYDWDGDGQNEVIVADDGHLIEIDGRTGKEKRRFAIPKHSSDCIVFCNLSGGDRADILVKDRYHHIWAFDYDGKQLWTIETPGGYLTAHQARVMDVDGDGKHEVQAGFALLNADGSPRWVLESGGKVMPGPFADGTRYKGGHLDCGRLVRRGDSPADTRIVLSFCAGDRIAMVDGDGKFLWTHSGNHYESIDIGRVRDDVPGPQIIADIPYADWGKKPIRVFDIDGNLLTEFLTLESRFHRLVDWFGEGVQSIAIGQDKALYDGHGQMQVRLDMSPLEGQPAASERLEIMCLKGDMDGDGREDLIYWNNPVSVVYIYRNERGAKAEDEAHVGTEVNTTLY